MTERQKRREARLQTIQVNTMPLHSTNNHAFHLNLSTQESWELLMRVSKESWFIETGEKASERLDRSVMRIVSKRL